MTIALPSFVTGGLDLDTDEGNAEWERRWVAYREEMEALIATGVLHKDHEGWWIHTTTGKYIGPDLDDEGPWTDEQLANAPPFAVAYPDLAASIKWAKNLAQPIKSGD